MGRITFESLEGPTKWFDSDAEGAKEFKEDTNWDGNNSISVATGSQWDHEILYRTRKGAWVKNTWSQMQGTIERYFEIAEEDAAQWLLENGHELPDGFSEEDYEG